jgi:hypothetical protein
MPHRRLLPQEVVTLLHHVELSNAGWRDRLRQQQVIASLLESRQPLTLTGIRDFTVQTFGSTGTLEDVEEAVRALAAQGKVVMVGANAVKLSEEAAASIMGHVEETRQADVRLRERFLAGLKSHGVTPRHTDEWEDFKEHCFAPLIEQAGARTYEFLTGGDHIATGTMAFRVYSERYAESDRGPLRRVIEEFLDPGDEDVRAFVLQQLQAHFLVRAGGLPQATVEALSGQMRQRIHLSILLDTNFLFSILELHDNPSNEAASELIRLLQDIERRVNLRLCVLPITIDEARRTLIKHEEHLAQVQLSARLGRIASVIDGDLSGITKRYVEASRQAGGRLSARDFFAPFIDNPLTVLRAKGVELHNADLGDWGMRQEIIDDILDQQRYEEKTRGARAKSYEALRHDTILWHYTSSRRPAALDSPLEAGYWVATVDYRLLAYDAYKQRDNRHPVPICVHPATLVQMLQFWAPRSREFDLALFKSIRAMLPRTFDIEAERAAISILGALSRFENVDDLPEDTITSILLNGALRQRIQGRTDVEEQVTLIREAMIEEVNRAKSELQEARRQEEATRSALEVATAQQSKMQQQVVALEKTLAQTEMDHGTTLRSTEEARRELEEKVAALEQAIEESKVRERQSAAARHTRNCRLVASVLAVSGIVGLGLVGWKVGGRVPMGALGSLWVSATGAATGAMIGMLVTEMLGKRRHEIRDWKVFTTFIRFKGWLLTTIGLFLVGVLQEVLGDKIKGVVP